MRKTLVAGVCGAALIGAAQLATAAPAATGEVGWTLLPLEVEPGGQIYAQTYFGQGNGCAPTTPVTSPGFAAPLQWTIGGNWGKHGGYGTVVKTPGKYTATFTCYDGRVASKTFTVIGTPPTSPPATTKPAPPKTTAKPPKTGTSQVPVKPVGAPQTGAGGTAG
ncbi:hypothetical protein [Amycolatopsis sp. NPDC058986]|uniref:hypothetical protein n=1 Tax=unclassified Amycolatopsis TaxID=2618356 RepID=UPI00366BD25C